MVRGVSRAIKAASCASCRIALVRSFTSIAGVQLSSSQLQNPSRGPLKLEARFISNTFQQPPPDLKNLQDEDDPSYEDKNRQQEINEIEVLKQDHNSSSLPWYLQVNKPIIIQRPLSERQKIPDLPKNSPQILQPLLQQISVDLGLDNLSLLDLRDLDPPPALGANLLMIIGTARSEKHLHVSADRLCRWLRSEYKLRPEADGLLGRNELKLKVRRKNRRAKLLGNGNADEDFDDGVRTGWVCVNVGVIDHPTKSHSKPPEDKNFVGFGRQTEGIKVVVQMLVEEKRIEIDLERLWGGIQKRQLLAKSEGIDDTAEVSVQEVRVKVPIDNNSPLTPKVKILAHISPNQSSTKGFHTSARLGSTHIATSSDSPSVAPALNNLEIVQLETQILSMMRKGDYHGVMKFLIDFQGPSNAVRSVVMGCLKQNLEHMPFKQALAALGKGPADFASTPFLSCLQLATSSFPSTEEWAFRVWLYCFARSVGHEGYDLVSLEGLFEQLQLSGIIISKELYLSIIRTALDRRACDNEEEVSFQVRIFVGSILENMHERHIPILAVDVLIALHESFPAVASDGGEADEILRNDPSRFEETENWPLLHSTSPTTRLNSLMQVLDIRVTEEDDLIRLLDAHANNREWPAFWDLWRSVPRSGKRRSKNLYAYMFKRIAETQHQSGCIKVLRSWIPDMDRETPSVELEGYVLDGVTACLAIADPSFNGYATTLGDSAARGEWISLWRRCYNADSESKRLRHLNTV